ncbi:hypothetical protein FRC03_005554 [Tulasnella sp. 419]|nr:hypothetical protein FRC03_005554 [Tulasnella sp. 419]
MGSRDEQNPPKIGENAIRWMLELYRHRCTLDESVSSEDLVEELASKTGYSQAQWRKRVANHGMDLAAIRREVMQERRGCENLETDDTEAEEGPISRRVGKQRSLSNQSIRRRYTEEEVNAMAKHLSKYSRGERSSIRVWEEYRHQHPHRTVGAYQQHYSKFRQKLDNLAYAYRYKGETQQTRVSKNQFSSKRVPHRRLLYRRWELDAMARHLSIYGPGASGMSIWRDFAVELTRPGLNISTSGLRSSGVPISVLKQENLTHNPSIPLETLLLCTYRGTPRVKEPWILTTKVTREGCSRSSRLLDHEVKESRP